MTVFNPVIGSSATYLDPQTAKVYRGAGASDPFGATGTGGGTPFDVSLNENAFLQQGDILAAPPDNAVQLEITQYLKTAHQAASGYSSSATPYKPDPTIASNVAAANQAAANITSQYQYSINGQYDQTYADLSQTLPATFTSTTAGTSLLKASRTAEAQQLATISSGGGSTAAQDAQLANVRLRFVSSTAYELQTAVNTPAPSAANSSAPPNPASSANALASLTNELNTAVQNYISGQSDPSATPDANFLQSAQSTSNTLHAIALALVPQLGAGSTPQLYNTSLYNANKTLASIDAMLGNELNIST